MLTLEWTEVLLYLGLTLVGGFCLGMGTALVWGRRREAPELPIWGRDVREWDEARWRAGSAADGAFRGVRWLPPVDGED